MSLCAKLTALCADREAMRRVGENAMRELYLSWEDAVARANERYAVVLDRYRAENTRSTSASATSSSTRRAT